MPTIKEVAGLAGVSVGTVSHVVTKSVPVSEPLRMRVEAAIRKLNYHPNHVARSLKTRRTRTLGIIVPDLTINFFPQIIRGAESAARENGYSLIAVNSSEDAERQSELLSMLRSQRVEGILLVIAAGFMPKKQLASLTEAGIPIVLLDRVPDDIEMDSVSIEDAEAAKMGVDHLIAQGYRRIAIVTGPITLKNERQRFLGYKKSLEKAAIGFDQELVWQSDLSSDQAQRLSTKKLKAMRPMPDAIFCTSAPAALGVLRSLRDLELKTPDDIGILTFDELTVDDLFRPALTTIAQPTYEIGYEAALLLLHRLNPKESAQPLRTVRLKATLKVRESSTRMQL